MERAEEFEIGQGPQGAAWHGNQHTSTAPGRVVKVLVLMVVEVVAAVARP